MKIEPCLGWAQESLTDYLKQSGLPEDELEYFEKDEITVALMGATQQGKTSLALRLLGATPSQIPDLDRALGGNSEVGRSRTRSTTILTAVGSDHYEKRLEEIARVILENEKNPAHELNIELPLDGGGNANITRVIDLVGLESRSETESGKALAELQTRKWLQRADLKLVVVRASAITSIVESKDTRFCSYRSDLRDLYGYWRVDPLTSFIGITFAWGDTKCEVIGGLAHKEFLAKASPSELQRETSKHLLKVLAEEFTKETELDDVSFPEVSVLPFSLPPEVDMTDPIQKKIFNATELSLNEIRSRVSEQKPLVFKLKSAFSHPRKLELDLAAKLARMEEMKEQYGLMEKSWDQKISTESAAIEKLKGEVKILEDSEKKLSKLKEGVEKAVKESILDALDNRIVGLPDIEGLREGKSWFRRQRLMREEILRILASCHETIRFSVTQCVGDFPNSNKSKFPSLLTNRVPFHSVAKDVSRCFEAQSKLLTMELIEEMLPSRWHKDDGWGEAKSILDQLFALQIWKAKNEAIRVIRNRFLTTGYFGVRKELSKKKELFSKGLKLHEKGLKDNQADRDSSLKSAAEELLGIEVAIKEVKNKLNSAHAYKEILTSNYIKYWNKNIDTINAKSTNDLFRLEKIIELRDAANLFHELTEFSTHQTSENR